jgi:fructan beta-fructosidase
MRPSYHYAPAANWLSDPNGLVHHNGEWHLFYQYNPQGEDWGHMSWGHAVSRDLVSWEELPPALTDDAEYMIFSGSAVVDFGNTAGFGAGAMVAIYTGAAVGEAARQVQCLAWSTDDGRTWTKYPGNPVIDRQMADFRDPNVFWHPPTHRWIMTVVLSNEQRALLYASRDLKDWYELSSIHAVGAPGEIWECPLLIELPVEATEDQRWLFKVDVLRGAPGSGALYQTGTFDGVRFHPDGPTLAPTWQVADMGQEFYAAIAWHDPRDERGRPAWIGWMGNHAYQGQLPRQGWRGAMSVPRRIGLRREGTSYRLVQAIEPDYAAQVPVVAVGTAEMPPIARVILPAERDVWLTLIDEAGRVLRIERNGATLFVSRRDPVSPFLDCVQKFERATGSELTVWLDRGSIEVLSADGTLSVSLQHRMSGSAYTAQWSREIANAA